MSKALLARMVVVVVVGWLAIDGAPAQTQAPSFPDPQQAARNGIPVAPGQQVENLMPSLGGFFPFSPLERDPTEGLRHGYVQTSSAKAGFRMRGLELPSRVPLKVGLVYDAGLLSSLPGIPYQEPRTSYDLGPNWLFTPVSALLPTGATTMVLLTDQGGVVPYQKESGGTRYFPAPDRASEFSFAEPTGDGGYRITMSSGLKRTYRTVPSEGNYWLVKEEDPSGNALNFTYNQGMLQRIDSTDGTWIRVYRGQFGDPAPPGTPVRRIYKAVDSAGRQLSFAFDTTGHLTSYTDVGGGGWQIQWDGYDHVRTVIDPLGRSILTFDTLPSSHKTVSVKVQDSQTSYTYNQTNTVVTGPEGGTWTYEFDAKGNTTRVTDGTGAVTQFTRSATTNDLTQVIDPTGGVHQFQHDAYHRITQYQGPSVAGGNAVWLFAYNAAGKLIRLTLPGGAVSTFGYDAQSRLTSEGTDPNGDGTAEATTTYERNAQGDITAVTDPVGRRTTYLYTATGLVSNLRPPCLGVAPSQVCPDIQFQFDAVGRTTKVRWPVASNNWLDWNYSYTATGALANASSPGSGTYTYQSDAVGAITQIVAPDGGTTLLHWRADGQLDRVEDALGNVSRWEYDVARRPVRAIDPLGQTWTLAYDNAHRITRKEDPTGRTWLFRFDAAGRTRETETPGGRVTRLFYDLGGRLTSRELPGGGLEQFTWDLRGNLLTATVQTPSSPNAIIDRWTYSWNGQSLPTELRQELGDGSANEVDRTLTFGWDLSGKLASYSDQDGRTWTITRDPWGRVAQATSGGLANVVEYAPWSGWVTHRYNAESQLDEIYTYNSTSGLIQTFLEKEGATTLQNVSLDWDPLGRLARMTDQTNTARQTVVTRNLVGWITQIDYPEGELHRMSYSPRGQVRARELRLSTGRTVNEQYGYDRAGLLTSFLDSTAGFVLEWDFNPTDPAAAFTINRTAYGGEIPTTELAYDSDSRIRSVTELADSGPITRRRFRWGPTAFHGATAQTYFSSTGAPEADKRYLAVLGRAAARQNANLPGAASEWQASILGIIQTADDGGWRVLTPGRGLTQPDENRWFNTAASGDLGSVMRRLGGQTLVGGLRLPAVSTLSSVYAPEAIATTARVRQASGSPDPRFIDQALGLPELSIVATSPGSADFAWGSPGEVTCLATQASGCRWEAVKAGRILRGKGKGDDDVYSDLPLSIHTTTVPPKVDWANTQPKTPVRNPDIDDLGVSLGNGEYSLHVTDATIAGRGIDLSLSRTYRSQNDTILTGGHGWFFDMFDERVEVYQDGSNIMAFWRAPGFTEQAWQLGTTSGDLPQPKVLEVGRARWDPAHTWTEIRFPDGTVRRYEKLSAPAGRNTDGAQRLVKISRPGSTPISVEWERVPYWAPNSNAPNDTFVLKRATLWSCDDDAITNPSGYSACAAGQKQELGHLALDPINDYEALSGGNYHALRVAVVVRRNSGEQSRIVHYDFFTQSCHYVADPYLTAVRVSCPGCTGDTTPKPVAGYEYSGTSDCGNPDPPAFQTAGNLVRIKDGASRVLLSLYYNLMSNKAPWTSDVIIQITAADGLTTNYSYPVTFSRQTTISRSGGSSVHRYDGNRNYVGHLVTVSRADATEVSYVYDDIGRLRKVTWPGANGGPGKVQEWIYPATHTYGGIQEAPSEFRETPGSQAHGEQTQISCFAYDPLTGDTYRALSPTGVDAGSQAPCASFTDTAGVLKAQASETIAGWMTACGAVNGAQITTDDALRTYLLRWGFVADNDDPPLPFRCESNTAQQPWLGKMREIGRAARTGTRSDGTVGALPSEQRPITQYQFNLQGALTKIVQPDGGEINYSYLPVGAVGPEAGSAENLGALAQREVSEPPSPTRKYMQERYVYDAFANTVQQRQLFQKAPERWLVVERQFDVKGLVLRETRSSDAANPLTTTTRFRYDDGARLLQKRVETTSPELNGGAVSWALIDYGYTAGGLLSNEKAWASSTGPDVGPWAGTGLSSERRLVYDKPGNVLQEAARLSGSGANTRWQITRSSYDLLNRPTKTKAYEEPHQGVDPPTWNGTSWSATPAGRYTVQRRWYHSLLRKPEWEQLFGSDGKIASTSKVVFDGMERPQLVQTCLPASATRTSGDEDTVPSCDRVLSAIESWYNAEGQAIKTAVSGDKTDQPSFARLALTLTDFDERARPYNTRRANAKLGEVPGECTNPNDPVNPCSFLESHVAYDIADRTILTARPKADQSGGWAVATITFDKLGRKIGAIDPLGNNVALDRNEAGRVVQSTLTEAPNALGARSFVTQFDYDLLGRPEAMRIADPANPGSWRKLQRRFDARDNVVAEWSPKAFEGLAPGTPPGDSYKSIQLFDGLGRKTQERRHIGSGGAQADPWQDLFYDFDDAGRLITITVEKNSTSGPGIRAQATRYEYDAQSRRTKRVMADGREERSEFDSIGRLSKTTFASSSATCGGSGAKCVQFVSSYDQASRRYQLDGSLQGAVASHYQSSSQTQTWAFDGLGRVIRTTDNNSDATGDEATSRVSFDTLGRVRSESQDGWITATTARSWTINSSYGLDGALRWLEYPAPLSGFPTNLLFKWDDLGRLSELIDERDLGTTSDDESTAKFGYIGAARLIRVEHADGSVWRAAAATDAGYWDSAGRRTKARVESLASGSLFYQEQFAFNANDEVTSVRWAHGRSGGEEEAQDFSYDELGRLVGFKQGKWIGSGVEDSTKRYYHNWTLDELGNWRGHRDETVPTSDPDWAPDVDGSNNAYTQWDGLLDSNGDGTADQAVRDQSLVYDEARAFLWERPLDTTKKQRYIHDLFGRLVRVEEVPSSGPVTVRARYGYHSSGLLAFREEAGLRTWLVYSGDRALVEETVSSRTSTHVWSGTGLIKTRDALGHETHLHADRLGSVVLQTERSTDGTTRIVERNTFDPYGKRVTLPAWSGPGISVPYGFAGSRYEKTVGLNLMGARWYDAVLGRFIEQDPIGEGGGLNLYAYTGSSPTMWVDPSGLQAQHGGLSGGPQKKMTNWEQMNARCTMVDGRSTRNPVTGDPNDIGMPGAGNQDAYTEDTSRADFEKSAKAWSKADKLAKETAETMERMAKNPDEAGAIFAAASAEVQATIVLALDRNVGGESSAGEEPAMWRKVLSFFVGLVPTAGTAQSAVELVSGKDYISGESASRTWAALGLFAGLLPAGKTGLKGLKAGLGVADEAASVGKVAAKEASRFSDDAVEAAGKRYPNKAGKIEEHHVTPKYLGGDPKGPTVPIDAAYHQEITNAFRAEWKYGGDMPSVEQLRDIILRVYERFPLPGQ